MAHSLHVPPERSPLMVEVVADDARLVVPLYTSAEVARYLDVPASTFARWVKGSRPLITGVRPAFRGAPSIPFIGLAEGVVLSALYRAGMASRQIRPTLDQLSEGLGVGHPLASRRLLQSAGMSDQ